MKKRQFIGFFVLLLVLLLPACEPSVEKYSLSVLIEGKGLVEPDSGLFAKDTIVTFNISPDKDWFFSYWEGVNKDDVQENNNGDWCILMDGNKELIAVFVEAEEEYKIDLKITGKGEVKIDPEKSSYAPGTIVKLIAVPEEGWRLKGWEGDARGSEEVLEVKMDSNKSITAVFEECG